MKSCKMADRYNLDSASVTCHSELRQFKNHDISTQSQSGFLVKYEVLQHATCASQSKKSCYKSLQESSYTDTAFVLSLITFKILRFYCKSDICVKMFYVQITRKGNVFQWYSHLCVRGVSNGGMILAGEYRITRWKTCQSATFSATNLGPGIEHGHLLWKADD